MSADTIENVGKAAWTVIKDGEPSIEISNSTANAVPQVNDWQQLEGTRGPMSTWVSYSRDVAWPFENYTFAEFTIVLKWDYGATYKGGGAYIPNIWTEVPQAYAAFTWKLNIGLRIHNLTNAGSKEAPIARVPITLTGSIRTYEQTHTFSWSRTIFGTGHWE